MPPFVLSAFSTGQLLMHQSIVLPTASYWASAPGLLHSTNQDAFIANPACGIWAIADGMGGHYGGEQASTRVVSACAAVAPAASLDQLVANLRRELNQANIELRQLAQSQSIDRIMGSTLVVLAIKGSKFACLWAGDSRLYLQRDHVLRQITKDHSLIQDLVRRGQISTNAAANHPAAHCVTRAIGTAGQLRLDEVRGDLEADDQFLLCSDGVSNVLALQQLQDGLTGPADNPADALIARAQQAGARDDLTLGMLRFQVVDVAGGAMAPNTMFDSYQDQDITEVNVDWR